MPTPPPDAAPARHSWVTGLTIFLAAVLMGIATLSLPLGRDHGIGLYVGDVIWQGGIPYQDAWDIKPPGLLYLHTLIVALMGKGAGVLRLFDLLWQALTAVSLCALGRRWFNGWAGFAAGLLYPFAYFWGNDFWHLGNFDAFLALPMTLTFLCLNRRTRKFDALAGLLIGFVFLARFTHGLLFLPALLLIFGTDAGHPYDWRPRVRRFAIVTASFLSLVGFFLLYLEINGALDIFLYTLFVFAPKYAVTTMSIASREFLELLRRVIADFGLRYAPITIPAFMAGAAMVAKKRDVRGLTLVVWAIATFIGFAIMAKFFAYHWLPLFAPLALLAGVFVSWVIELTREKRWGWAGAGAAVLLLCVGSFLWRFGPKTAGRTTDLLRLVSGRVAWVDHLAKFDTVPQGGDFSATANYLVAEYLRANTKPDDPVFVWGFEQLIYYLSDRYPPTRFCSNFAHSAKWRRDDWTAELTADLQATPPAYIVLVTGDVMPWVTGHGMDSLTVLRREFGALSSWISSEYAIETKIENMIVCRRKNLPPAL